MDDGPANIFVKYRLFLTKKVRSPFAPNLILNFCLAHGLLLSGVGAGVKFVGWGMNNFLNLIHYLSPRVQSRPNTRFPPVRTQLPGLFGPVPSRTASRAPCIPPPSSSRSCVPGPERHTSCTLLVPPPPLHFLVSMHHIPSLFHWRFIRLEYVYDIQFITFLLNCGFQRSVVFQGSKDEPIRFRRCWYDSSATSVWCTKENISLEATEVNKFMCPYLEFFF